jgi:hypothetical protein
LDFIERGEYDLAKEFLRSHIFAMLSYIEQVLSKHDIHAGKDPMNRDREEKDEKTILQSDKVRAPAAK